VPGIAVGQTASTFADVLAALATDGAGPKNVAATTQRTADAAICRRVPRFPTTHISTLSGDHTGRPVCPVSDRLTCQPTADGPKQAYALPVGAA
jgi:hypothetical protein